MKKIALESANDKRTRFRDKETLWPYNFIVSAKRASIASMLADYVANQINQLFNTDLHTSVVVKRQIGQGFIA